MSSDIWLTALAILLSVVSVIVSGMFSVRTARLSHTLEDDRAQRLEEQSALTAAERVYEPLAQAAAELQSRIFNIVETGWVPLMKRYKSHGDYAVTSTAFLLAHYFGWIDARRQAILSSSGESGATNPSRSSSTACSRRFAEAKTAKVFCSSRRNNGRSANSCARGKSL